MAKDKSATSKARRASVQTARKNGSSNSKRGNGAPRRRWDPADISAEFIPPEAVLEDELRAIEAFMKNQVKELLGRNNRFSLKSKGQKQ